MTGVTAVSTPIQVSFSTVLHAHARAGNAVEAQAWLERMRHASIEPDAVSYNTVCSAWARRGDAAAALACYSAMQAAGVRASATTHSIMINALVQVRVAATTGVMGVMDVTLVQVRATGHRMP